MRSEHFIKQALKETEEQLVSGLSVPLAPAEGLVMVESVYTRYCGKNTVERIGIGTKECRQDNMKGAKSDEAAQALVDSTKQFQMRVHAQILKDQAVLTSIATSV